MVKYLDYRGLERLVLEQDKRYKNADREAIAVGAIHGLFAETMPGGVVYNGALGDFTINGLSSTDGLQLDGKCVTLAAGTSTADLHFFGCDKATITIGDARYTLSNTDVDATNGLELTLIEA